MAGLDSREFRGVWLSRNKRGPWIHYDLDMTEKDDKPQENSAQDKVTIGVVFWWLLGGLGYGLLLAFGYNILVRMGADLPDRGQVTLIPFWVVGTIIAAFTMGKKNYFKKD